MKIISVNGVRLINIFRYIKCQFSKDVHEATQIAPFGDDSCPPLGLKGIMSETDNEAINVVLGYFNRDCQAQKGEKRFYSLKEDGSLGFWVWLKNDGKIEIGNDTTINDFIVSYNKLETEFKSLQSTVKSIVDAYNLHTHILTLTSGTGTAAPTANTASEPTANIENTKITNINLKTT
jgi:hypothetical protein